MAKDVFYPQTIESLPFIGPKAPEKESSRSSGTVVYPAQIKSQAFPQGVTASKLINQNLNTQSRQILSSFSFGRSGAIQIGNFQSGSSGDIRISPNGIVARNSSGATTFSIDGTTGSATFMGTLAAGSVIASSVTVDWAQIQNVEVENADIVSINASKITAGTLSADRIGAGSITAAKLSVSTLSAISANLGTVTAGSITGVTITGGLLRTSGSGARVEVGTSITSAGDISWYNGSGLRGRIYATTNLFISGAGSSVALDDHIDMVGHDITHVDVMAFESRNSAPGDRWAIYAYDSNPGGGGTKEIRTRVNGSNYRIDQTSV